MNKHVSKMSFRCNGIYFNYLVICKVYSFFIRFLILTWICFMRGEGVQNIFSSRLRATLDDFLDMKNFRWFLRVKILEIGVKNTSSGLNLPKKWSKNCQKLVVMVKNIIKILEVVITVVKKFSKTSEMLQKLSKIS